MAHGDDTLLHKAVHDLKEIGEIIGSQKLRLAACVHTAPPLCPIWSKADARSKRRIDLLHRFFIQRTHALAQPGFVYGAELLQQDNGIMAKPDAAVTDMDMGGQIPFPCAAGDGRSDKRRAVAVADVVLQNQDRADAALLRADGGVQVGIVDIPAPGLFLSVHKLSSYVRSMPKIWGLPQ